MAKKTKPPKIPHIQKLAFPGVPCRECAGEVFPEGVKAPRTRRLLCMKCWANKKK